MKPLKTKWRTVLLAVLCIMLFAGTKAAAEQAQDITTSFQLIGKGAFKISRLYDGDYVYPWISSASRLPVLTFKAKDPSDKAYGLYVCFEQMPPDYVIQTQDAQREWQTVLTGDTRFLHTYLPLPGLSHFRLAAPSDSPQSLKIKEIQVFSGGTLPAYVQQWQETPNKADLLLITATPGDEALIFGGLIPTYATQRHLSVVTACITGAPGNANEWLNSLWHLGYRNYPVMGGFPKSTAKTADKVYEAINPKTLRLFIMTLLRQTKPDVLITPGQRPGVGLDAAISEMAAFCVTNGDNPAIEPALFKSHGGWQVQKLYRHGNEHSLMRMDWLVPLSSFGGQTGLLAAEEAYALHNALKKQKTTVSTSGVNDCTVFDLVYTAVGPDRNQDDFMENIIGKGEITYVPQEPVQIPASDAQKDAQSPAWKADWPFEAGTRNARGYLQADECVLLDEDKGLWFYANQSLVVRIDRKEDAEASRVWYQAHIFTDLDSGERVFQKQHTPLAPGKTRVQLSKIAKENQVVFAMNTDYYTYRLGGPIQGIVIRDGQIYHDTPPKRNRSKFPNLDVLAMFGDGDWKVYYADEYTARELVQMGAVNVYSFGPYMVRGGILNPFIDEMYAGKTPQPRCALGMIEKGHYYAAMEEGRFKFAKGTSLKALAEHMHEMGCQEALNMDGGQTALFCFMGNQITRIAVYQEGGGNLARTTSELIGAGFSKQIDPLN